MKLGLGLYKSLLNDNNFEFAKQAGATHLVVHLVDYFNSDGNNPELMQDYLKGWGVTKNQNKLWEYDQLIALKKQIESHGLKWEAIENFDPSHWYDILLDGPKKDQQLENLKYMIRNIGKAGIPILGYYFSLAGVWGWSRYEQWLGVGPGEFKGEARLGAAWRQAVVRGAIETEGPLVWLGVCVWCSEDEGMEGWCASKSWLLWAGFGVQELGSVVGLEVQDGGTVLCVEAVVVEQHGTMGEGKLWGPREALVGWQSGGAWRQPNLVGVQGLDWGAGEVEPLDVGDQEQWGGWWLDKGEEAVRACY